MIKGVNKQILEVTNTENPYFEKIIFFVKPEYKELDYQTLKKEAHQLATTCQKPPKARLPRRQKRQLFASLGLMLLTSVAMSYLLSFLF